MKKAIAVLMAVCFAGTTLAQQQPVDNSFGTLPPFTNWYQNPLGVSPIALHTGNGLYIPLIAATGILIFTKKYANPGNRLSLYADISYTKGYYGSFSNLMHQHTGINYMLRKYMSAGVELSQVYVWDNVNNSYGIGIRPFVRFYPVNNGSFKLYFQSGAGLQYFFNAFPQPSGFYGDYRKGTKLNGSPKYGIGAELKLNTNWNIHAGLWHIHFSNGNHPGIDRNPGHDSNGFSIGVTYKPTKK